MQKIGATGDGKSAVAIPDGKKPKEEEEGVRSGVRVKSVLGLWLRLGLGLGKRLW